MPEHLSEHMLAAQAQVLRPPRKRSEWAQEPTRSLSPIALATDDGGRNLGIEDLEGLDFRRPRAHLAGDILADPSESSFAVLEILLRVPDRARETPAGLAVDQENGCSSPGLLLDGRYGLGLVVGDGLVNSRRITVDGRNANPGSRLRWLEALLDGDLALVFLGDGPTHRLHDLVGLPTSLSPSLLHILLGLPVGNAQPVPGLPVPHERHPREAFLPFDEGQDVLRPQLEVLIGSGGIALHANYASVHAWHLLKGEYDLPE